MNKLVIGICVLAIVECALGQGAIESIDRIDPAETRDDTDRNPVHTIVPEYPQKAWFERIEGDVEVCFFVTRGGRPYNISVRRSDHRIFERVSRKAVKKSWFEPIPRPAKVPQVKTCRTFMFRLESVEKDEVTVDVNDVG